MPLISRDTGAQEIESALTDTERTFLLSVAFPHLDSAKDNSTLEKLSEVLWNLCSWEQLRATALDTKAGTLTGLSSLAAAVTTASSAAAGTVPPSQLVARCVAVGFFIVTVVLAIRVQLVQRFKGFLDADVFAAVGSHKVAVGDFPRFADGDQYRCFLRETCMQRWLIYRSYAGENNLKATRLKYAQILAGIATCSLIAVLITGFLG